MPVKGEFEKCYNDDMAQRNELKHQHLKEFNAWQAARQRCTNPNNPAYKDYGGRGIIMSPEWDTFAAFFRDMGPCPPGFEIDRIDNDGNYEPGNCRWTDSATQKRNRRNNVWIEWRGERKVMSDWCSESGVPFTTALHRIQKGYPLERVFSKSTLYSISHLGGPSAC